MKIVIKNSFLDLLSFGKHIRIREKLFDKASSAPRKEGTINSYSKKLHPVSQDLVVRDIIDECPGMKSYILEPSSDKTVIAPFRAGQYLVLSTLEEGLILRRPYSISSSPAESVDGNFYRITIKHKSRGNDGYFSDHVFRNWSRGTRIIASGPQGYFYYNTLRDAPNLVCIAGGSGITPFCSMIPDLLKKAPDIKIYLFYGFNKAEDESFSEDFKALASVNPENFFYNPLCMETDGVISSAVIKESLSDNSGDISFFICGPPALHRYMDSELASFSLKPKYIRRESYGSATDSSAKSVQEYRLVVQGTSGDKVLSAFSNETLLTTLEKGGINAPSLCRAGECGWCRSQLLSGEISTDQGLTGIRQADKKFGWIHPCTAFPRGDIIIRVSENPD